MAQPNAGPNYPLGAYLPPSPPSREKNTVGLIALIVGAVGFVFACIPGALVVGWVLLPIAFVLGIVGVCLSGKTNGTSIAAIIVSIVGGVVGVVVFFVLVGNAFSDAFRDSDLSSQSESRTQSSPRTTTGSPKAGTRENPFKIGQLVSNRDWEVTLGPPREGGAAVAAENQFNDPPEAGMEFWIVPVTATYTGSDTGSPAFGINVEFVGSDNRTYSDRCGVIPNPLADVGNLYSGGVAEGNVCVQIPAGADGLWTVSTGFASDPAFFDAN